MMSFTLHCLLKALGEIEDDRKLVIAFCRSPPIQERKPMQFGDVIFDELHALVINTEEWGIEP